MRFPRTLVLISCWLNAILLCGSPKQSICSRVYDAAHTRNNRLAALAVPVIDRIFWFDPQHTYNSWRQWKALNRDTT